ERDGAHLHLGDAHLLQLGPLLHGLGVVAAQAHLGTRTPALHVEVVGVAAVAALERAAHEIAQLRFHGSPLVEREMSGVIAAGVRALPRLALAVGAAARSKKRSLYLA